MKKVALFIDGFKTFLFIIIMLFSLGLGIYAVSDANNISANLIANGSDLTPEVILQTGLILLYIGVGLTIPTSFGIYSLNIFKKTDSIVHFKLIAALTLILVSPVAGLLLLILKKNKCLE